MQRRYSEGLLWLFFLSACSLVIFSGVLNYPFFQDDFFVLETSKIKSTADLGKLFYPVPGVVYWRPIGMQLYFGVMQFLGLNSAIFFHITAVFWHFVNIYLVYRLTRDLFSDQRLAKYASWFYATTPIHYFALGWAVNFSYILLITWVLAGLLALISKKPVWGILWGILAIMTNEIGIVFPVLALIAPRRSIKINRSGDFARLICVLILSLGVAAYLLLRWHWGVKVEGDYRVSFTQSFATLKWYGLWMLGWSDIVRNHIANFLIFRKDFFMAFPEVVVVYYIELAVMGSVILNYLRNAWRRKVTWHGIRRMIMWTVISLSPVLFFSQHLYSHYALLASVGFYWFMARVVISSGPLVQKIVLLVWLAMVGVTMRLNCLTSWMGDHARHSMFYQQSMLEQIKEIPGDFSVYVVTHSDKVKMIMADGYGISRLYGIDPDRVFYFKSKKQLPYAGEVSESWLEKNKIAIFYL